MRHSFLLLGLLSLSACGDPLANFDRIDDVEVADEASVAQALPDADDVAPTDGVLSRLLDRTPEEGTVADEIAVPNDVNIDPVVSAAPDGTADVAVTSGIDEDAISAGVNEAVAEAAAPQSRGIGGWLRRAAAAQVEPVIETVAVNDIPDPTDVVLGDLAQDGVAQVDVVQAEVVQNVPEDVVVAQIEEPTEATEPDLVEPAKRRGLLGLLQPVEDAPETVRTASLDPQLSETAVNETPVTAVLAEPKKRRGLFGGAAAKPKVRNGPDARDVTFGTVLPYGEVARMCEVNNSNVLGRRVDIAPEQKGRGYSLYDSAPDTAGPRTFYVTGFTDNCARQFTAALAVFGSPETHEQLRYGLPSKSYPYSTTDEAYEKVKSSVCKVGKGKPCGNKISTLERNTVFVSTYEKFTDNARWSDILLHDGVVVAAAIKTP